MSGEDGVNGEGGESEDARAVDEDLVAAGALSEPTRRRLYEHVVAARRAVTRDEAAAAVRVERSTAAYHLDRLVEEGLLEASFARPEGGGGPGAGRPAKRYERGERELSISVPPRDYRLLAELLARAAEEDVVRSRVERVARAAGAELAGSRADGDVIDVLAELGFEPYDEGATIELGNCPFHRLAAEHTELVCGMNLALIGGLVDAVTGDVRARLDPDPSRCCVVLDRRVGKA